MGGEPTFVSIDNMDGDEWNYAATGPEKRLLAGRLLERLRARFAPGALLHFGTGKWYPGEPLPRWALSLLLAQGRNRRSGTTAGCRPTRRTNRTLDAAEAQRFAETLARRLGLDPQYVESGV